MIGATRCACLRRPGEHDPGLGNHRWYQELLPRVHSVIHLAVRSHTVQGVDAAPLSIITGPQDWRADEFNGAANTHKWQYSLTPGDVAEIEAALAGLQQRGLRIEVGSCWWSAFCSLASCLRVSAGCDTHCKPSQIHACRTFGKRMCHYPH